MRRSREQEAGVLYEEGVRWVRAGGDNLQFLASHLVFMVRGTERHQGPLWPIRQLGDGTIRQLDCFINYLREPVRDGLGIPSLHFLRQVLAATPAKGDEALMLVRQQLATEGIDFDAEADRERDVELLKREPGRTGVHTGVNLTPLPKAGIERQAARLAARRSDLADKVRAGTMTLANALKAAGIRKTKTPVQQVMSLLPKLSEFDLDLVRDEINKRLKECAVQ